MGGKVEEIVQNDSYVSGLQGKSDGGGSHWERETWRGATFLGWWGR